MKRLVIAAPHSGSGKTTVTLGLMAALGGRGLPVAPFKVGPDFIDPGYHRLVTGRPSVNLDGWMCGLDFVRESFARHAASGEIAVIEGVMGLFDGIDGRSEAGSTAEIAKALDAPVLLVVDARSQARSAAALVQGFAGFDRGLRVAGVVFNNVGSANHEAILREAVAAACPGVAVIGCLPRDAALAIPSRHLGLVTADDNPLSEEFLGHLRQVIEDHLDLEALVTLAEPGSELAPASPPLQQPSPRLRPSRKGGPAFAMATAGAQGGLLIPSPVPSPLSEPVPIAVARDAAFCFVYEDNLRLLEEAGAELRPFSPLTDSALPEGCCGLYLPGGYPELFARQLSENVAMREGIRAAVEAGLPVYAECGGFIYLTQGVETPEGVSPLAGVFPVQTRMLPRRKALGYREVQLQADCLLGSKGSSARGHEFHYSEIGEMPSEVERVYQVSRKGQVLGLEGYRYRNCLASYVHIHFGSASGLAPSLVQQCRHYRQGERYAPTLLGQNL